LLLFPAHTYLELILSPTLSQGQYTGAPCTDPSHKSCSQATLNTGSRFLHMVMFNYKTTQCHTDLLLMSISHWLMALIGAPNSTLFPHAERMVPPPPPKDCSMVEPPARCSFPHGFGQLFTIFPPLSLPSYLSQPYPLTFCFSSFLPFIIYQFILLSFILPPFLCILLCPPCTTQTLLYST
jgi:hypothetical protein